MTISYNFQILIGTLTELISIDFKIHKNLDMCFIIYSNLHGRDTSSVKYIKSMVIILWYIEPLHLLANLILDMLILSSSRILNHEN